MEYNTQLPKLVISEYGRNVQKMIEHACSIKNKAERNKAAQAIIDFMGRLNPHLRDVTDFKHKLWDHLFVISDFKLDVESPYPRPKREDFISKPERLQYPKGDIRYKHYGKFLEQIIQKAKAFKEGDEKKYLVEVIANLLKRSYLNWNRDSVNDEVILQHLDELSGGKLKLDKDFRLSQTSEILAKSGLKKPQDSRDQQRKRGGQQKRRRNFRR